MPQHPNKFQKQYSNFPHHPKQTQNTTYTSQINKLITRYHNKQLINIQDTIKYQNYQQYFKKYYTNFQCYHKIKLLIQFYSLSSQYANTFIHQFERLLANYHHLKNNIFQQSRHQPIYHQQNDNMDANNVKHLEQHEKLIKDIQLSYFDFQDKPHKKSKYLQIPKQKTSKLPKQTKQLPTVIKKKQFVFIFKSRNKNHQKKQQHHITIQPHQINIQQQYKNSHHHLKYHHQYQANYFKISQQQLNRSKSKIQLHNINQKKYSNSSNNFFTNFNTQYSQQIKKINSLEQNSFVVNTCNKKEILGNNKNIVNTLVNNNSKTNLKLQQKPFYCSQKNIKLKAEQDNLQNYQIISKNYKIHQEQNVKPLKKDILIRKTSSSHIETVPKMFNRALQLKKRKNENHQHKNK